jgi:hypothetical protein
MSAARHERGQVIPLVAVFMVVLLGMTAFVLDVGSWYRADRAAQAAADAAALAGAHGLPHDTGEATGLAVEYTGKNGGGLAGGGITFSGRAVPNDTISVEISRSAPGFFAKVFGIDSITVNAKASARAVAISEPKWVAPIVVNEKHPMLTCQPQPCFGDATELNYYHLKTGGNQTDGSGSFGFINLVGGGNPGTSEMGNWIKYGFDKYMKPGEYEARTGNPFSSSHIEDSLRDRIGSEILFPIYRKLTGGGSNAKYDVVGWVGFHLTGLDVHGNNEKLYGYFTQVIWDGVQATPGTPPAYGVRSIALVE